MHYLIIEHALGSNENNISDNYMSSSAPIKQSVSKDGMSSSASFVIDGNTHTLTSEDLNNGDILFFQYINDQLTDEAVLYHDQRDRLYRKSYIRNDDNIIIETIETVEMLEISDSRVMSEIEN